MKKQFLLFLIASLLGISPFTSARALPLTWRCTDNFWNNPSCWTSSTGLPTGTDTVVVPTVFGGNTLLRIDKSVGSAFAGTININPTAGTTVALFQTGGILTAGYETIGNNAGTGVFTQSGGTHVVSTNLTIGDYSTGTGVYTLSGGTLNIGGNIVNGAGTSTLNVNGGAFNVAGSIDVDYFNIGVSGAPHLGSGNLVSVSQATANNGTLALAGGTLSGATLTQGATGTTSGYGIVSTNVNNAGTVNAKSGNLILNGASSNNAGLVKNSVGSNLFIESPTVNNGGNIEVNSAGSVVFDAAISNAAGKNVALLGGTLATPTLTNQAGGNVKGFGTLTGNLTNAGSVEFYGPTNIVGNVANQTGGTMLVRNDQTLITGQTVNDGTIHTLKGTVIFEGGLINNGVYLSDPSKNYFTNLVINNPGYLVGEAGDKFFVSGNLENHSLQNTLWNTDAASLFLNGTGTQNLYLAGSDPGALTGGYGNNFAWGEFSLGSDVSVHLWDGNSAPGAALYVGLFEVGDGLGQLANITSDFNIYYDPNLSGNAYLGGLKYALNGAGFLMPSAVPIPPAVWLFGSGLLGLVGIARRRGKVQGA